MNNTLSAFLENDNLSVRLSEKILKNLTEKQEREMIFNLTNIEFDFTNESVIIMYYVKDENYPNASLTFDEIRKIIGNRFK